MSAKQPPSASDRLDEAVARATRERGQREQGYRERALKMYPWICGRCRREFTRETVAGLTVHHRDHNHDNNPADGSNWELLCLYCHDNEHSRLVDADRLKQAGPGNSAPAATHKPFADLAALLGRKPEGGGSGDA